MTEIRQLVKFENRIREGGYFVIDMKVNRPPVPLLKQLLGGAPVGAACLKQYEQLCSVFVQVYIVSVWSLRRPNQRHMYALPTQHHRQLYEPVGHRVMC